MSTNLYNHHSDTQLVRSARLGSDRFRWIMLALPILLILTSPMALLLVNLALPFQRLLPGELPAASWIDTLIAAIFYGHLGLCLCALVCIFKFGYTSQFRAAILLAALGSIPLMAMGVLCVTMSKTGKWL